MAKKLSINQVLWNAVGAGRADYVLEALTSGANPSSRRGVWCVLGRALHNQHAEIAALLLNHGADPKALDNNSSMVQIAAASDKLIDISQLLIHKGCPATFEAVCVAARNGNRCGVDLLLASGACAVDSFSEYPSMEHAPAMTRWNETFHGLVPESLVAATVDNNPTNATLAKLASHYMSKRSLSFMDICTGRPELRKIIANRLLLSCLQYGWDEGVQFLLQNSWPDPAQPLVDDFSSIVVAGFEVIRRSTTNKRRKLSQLRQILAYGFRGDSDYVQFRRLASGGDALVRNPAFLYIVGQQKAPGRTKLIRLFMEHGCSLDTRLPAEGKCGLGKGLAHVLLHAGDFKALRILVKENPSHAWNDPDAPGLLNSLTMAPNCSTDDMCAMAQFIVTVMKSEVNTKSAYGHGVLRNWIDISYTDSLGMKRNPDHERTMHFAKHLLAMGSDPHHIDPDGETSISAVRWYVSEEMATQWDALWLSQTVTPQEKYKRALRL